MKICKPLLACVLIVGCLFSIATTAEVSMNATRITAPDPEKLAEFYKNAFGMHEVQRIPLQEGVEIMLNFGATVEAAKANTGAQVVLFPRSENEAKDTTPHLIFSVTDMNATVASLKKVGGTMDGEVIKFGDSGILIGMGIDPVGNHFELLYFPAK